MFHGIMIKLKWNTVLIYIKSLITSGDHYLTDIYFFGRILNYKSVLPWFPSDEQNTYNVRKIAKNITLLHKASAFDSYGLSMLAQC